MASELTEDTVIGDGGWDQRYARVLVIQQVGDEALALVDGNGDGAEIESEHWFETPDGWVGASSQGIGPLVDRPIWTWGEVGDSGFVIGRTSEPGQVTVEWLGRRSTGIPNEVGVWIALFPDFEMPPEPQLVEMAESQGFRTWGPGEWELQEARHPKLVNP